ncbi:membrane protein [Crucian carp herpesvirus]|uniref:Membrane ORF25 n=2 Tax=Cyprinid herpesvirus 2 TaxID=317878 RepID=K7PBN4_CYHV2|nr:membrane protein ORF25 [Cyprinid herpesvirus 2]AFJ20466.1 membrane protein ORF25 [Cyprinid herpesvirus 2]AMB21594.1 membrane ORF25 [Cyprinid herpesvirus 2]APB92875.1 membrane protein [Crucian carp herpesvirus]
MMGFQRCLVLFSCLAVVCDTQNTTTTTTTTTRATTTVGGNLTTTTGAFPINSLVYTVDYKTSKYCAVNGLPYEIKATFSFDRYDIRNLQWLAFDAVLAAPKFVFTLTRPPSTPYGANNPMITTLRVNPFLYTDATVDYAISAVGLLPTFDLIKMYSPLPSGSIKVSSLSVYTTGIDPITYGTILTCQSSCQLDPELKFAWYNYDQLVVGAETNTLTTSNPGLYMCTVQGSLLFSTKTWVGRPVFDCPFNANAWCTPSTTQRIQRYEDDSPRSFIEDDLKQPGTVLACLSANDTVKDIVSLRGRCSDRTVCNMEVSDQCSNFIPNVYNPCNVTVHKFCPTQLPFTWTSPTPELVSVALGTNNLMFSSGIVNTYCGNQADIFAVCAGPDKVTELSKRKIVFQLPTLDVMQINDDVPTPEIVVLSAGQVFDMACPSTNLVVYWRRESQRMASSLGPGNVRLLRKTVTREDLNATWSCVDFDTYNAHTAVLFRKVFLTDVPPTTPAPPTTTTTTPSTVPTTPKTTTQRTTTPTTTTTTTTTTTPATTTTTTTIAATPPPTTTAEPTAGDTSPTLTLVIVVIVFETILVAGVGAMIYLLMRNSNGYVKLPS